MKSIPKEYNTKETTDQTKSSIKLKLNNMHWNVKQGLGLVTIAAVHFLGVWWTYGVHRVCCCLHRCSRRCKGHCRRHCVRGLDVQVQIFRMIFNTRGIWTLDHSMFQKTKMHALENHFRTYKESLCPFLLFSCTSVGL